MQPLKDWRIIVDAESGKKSVSGISWWDDYSNIKHQTFWKFDLATLKIAVNALASLMVLELYLMQSILGSVKISLDIKCEYFGAILCTEEKTYQL